MTGFEVSVRVIPTKVGIQFFEFQSFPINCLSIECLDSRLRGNDESIHTETYIPSFLRTYIPSFPRKWESRIPDFQIIFEYCCCSKV
ncbi:hypothetical protein COH80_09590 [Neisseria meningitidis]|nr:hypothetical protein COH80_09590 [Neisseria meningitidis]